MGILLILGQVALLILDLLAHVVTLNLWLVFLPSILFAALYLIGRLNGVIFVIDSFTSIYRRPTPTPRRPWR